MSNVLDLGGLFADDLALYNKIISAYYVKLSSISASALVSCNITINDVELKNSNNCSINIVNKCYSNSFLTLNTLLETIIENLEFISDDIRNRIEKNLGIVLDTSINQSDKGFIKRCNAYASVSNSINIKKLSINNCNSGQPLVFDFYNTGDAKVNCGIVELVNALSNKDKSTEEGDIGNKYDFILNKVFGLNLEDYIYLVLISFLILLIILIVTNENLKQLVIFKFKSVLP